MVAVVQLPIALGAGIGGILFEGHGYAATFGTSAAILVVAAIFGVSAAPVTRCER